MQVLGILWLLALCVGHMALLIFSINWWYSVPLRSRFLSSLRLVHVALIFVGWTAFTGFYFESPWLTETLDFGPLGRSAAQAYALLCGVIGLGYVPWITLRRCTRGRPCAFSSLPYGIRNRRTSG